MPRAWRIHEHAVVGIILFAASTLFLYVPSVAGILCYECWDVDTGSQIGCHFMPCPTDCFEKDPKDDHVYACFKHVKGDTTDLGCARTKEPSKLNVDVQLNKTGWFYEKDMADWHFCASDLCNSSVNFTQSPWVSLFFSLLMAWMNMA